MLFCSSTSSPRHSSGGGSSSSSSSSRNRNRSSSCCCVGGGVGVVVVVAKNKSFVHATVHLCNSVLIFCWYPPCSYSCMTRPSRRTLIAQVLRVHGWRNFAGTTWERGLRMEARKGDMCGTRGQGCKAIIPKLDTPTNKVRTAVHTRKPC